MRHDWTLIDAAKRKTSRPRHVHASPRNRETLPSWSDFDLLCYRDCVVDFDAQIPDGAEPRRLPVLLYFNVAFVRLTEWVPNCKGVQFKRRSNTRGHGRPHRVCCQCLLQDEINLQLVTPGVRP